jgi:hypothetical protein
MVGKGPSSRTQFVAIGYMVFALDECQGIPNQKAKNSPSMVGLDLSDVLFCLRARNGCFGNGICEG